MFFGKNSEKFKKWFGIFVAVLLILSMVMTLVPYLFY